MIGEKYILPKEKVEEINKALKDLPDGIYHKNSQTSWEFTKTKELFKNIEAVNKLIDKTNNGG